MMFPNGAGYPLRPTPLSELSGSKKPEEKNLLSPALHRDIFLFTHRKAERLSAAVYLVTSFFSDSEPIRWKMRETALSVLENISALRGGTHYEREFAVASTLRGIHDMLSLVEIAAMSGMMSEMNYRVLKAEYGALRQEIHERDNIHTPEHFEIPKDFFKEGNEDASLPRKDTVMPTPRDAVHGMHTPEVPESYKGHTKGQDSVLNTTVHDALDMLNDTVRKNVSVNTSTKAPLHVHGVNAEVRTAKPSKTVAQSNRPLAQAPKGGRRGVVLDLFAKNGAALTVKDVAKAIAPVSEKTAQRELAALVDEGVLKRTGERRWSIYSRA